MAREIKFRAWHKLKKRWFTGREILGYINIISNDDKYIAGDFLQIPNLSNYDFVFAQYTGLTDKNGKEIYEGDVVQIPCDRKCIIKYADHISAFVLVEIGGNKISNNLLLKIDYASYEVIGNIYENPELI